MDFVASMEAHAEQRFESPDVFWWCCESYLPSVHCTHFRGVQVHMQSEFVALGCLSRHLKVVIVHSNQHKLGDDMGNDPKSSSFYMAMCLSEGVLLILDGAATPFKRSWW